MKAAKKLGGLAKAVVLTALVATILFAPLGVMPVSADGGSNGQPGQLPDSTAQKMPTIVDPTEVSEPLFTASLYLTVLRFVEL